MKYQGGFETFKEATRYMFQPDLRDILPVLFGFIASLLVLIVLPYTISKYLASRSARRGFEVIGKQMGLNEEEIALLYKCASTLEDPNKVFYSKYIFERCAGKLVKESSDNIPIISTEGVKVCFNRFVSAKEGDSLLLEFEWKGEAFKNILAEIRHITVSTDRTCFGLKFLNLRKDYEDTIRRFIIEEQREALRIYKMDR